MLTFMFIFIFAQEHFPFTTTSPPPPPPPATILMRNSKQIKDKSSIQMQQYHHRIVLLFYPLSFFLLLVLFYCFHVIRLPCPSTHHHHSKSFNSSTFTLKSMLFPTPRFFSILFHFFLYLHIVARADIFHERHQLIHGHSSRTSSSLVHALYVFCKVNFSCIPFRKHIAIFRRIFLISKPHFLNRDILQRNTKNLSNISKVLHPSQKFFTLKMKVLHPA